MIARILLLFGLVSICPVVLAGTNTPPELLSPIVYQAVGQPQVDYDVLNGYSDSEGHGISSIEGLGVTGDVSVGISGTTITLVPTNPNIATPDDSPYEVLFKVCDDGDPSECTNAVLTVFYNDPPDLTPVAANASSGKSLEISFSEFLVGTGVCHGDEPSDGDTNAIASTAVSSSSDGLFSNFAALPGGSNCGVSGADISNLAFTASHPITEVVETCYVRICEELPLAPNAVCSVTEVTITVRAPLLKDGFEDAVVDG